MLEHMKCNEFEWRKVNIKTNANKTTQDFVLRMKFNR